MGNALEKLDKIENVIKFMEESDSYLSRKAGNTLRHAFSEITLPLEAFEVGLTLSKLLYFTNDSNLRIDEIEEAISFFEECLDNQPEPYRHY